MCKQDMRFRYMSMESTSFVCFFDGIPDSHNEGQSANRPIGDNSLSSVKVISGGLPDNAERLQLIRQRLQNCRKECTAPSKWELSTPRL